MQRSDTWSLTWNTNDVMCRGGLFSSRGGRCSIRRSSRRNEGRSRGEIIVARLRPAVAKSFCICTNKCDFHLPEYLAAAQRGRLIKYFCSDRRKLVDSFLKFKAESAKGVHLKWAELKSSLPGDTFVCEEHERSVVIPAGKFRESALLKVESSCSWNGAAAA